MTNDLMLEVIEGRLPETPRQRRERVMADVQKGIIPMVDALNNFGHAMSMTAWQIQIMARAMAPKRNEPADPRERALRAKQQRGTGPVVPVRERGLVTKYKEKS